MLDCFNRDITYLRISITDRCNLRCTYCIPDGEFKHIDHSQILRFEEIYDFIKIAIDFGINKIRLTGGEPLVRKGTVDFISKLVKLDGIKDLSITTNGILLKQYAKPLFDSGLKRINISLDTLNKDKFYQLTRGGNLMQVLEGIDEAISAGFNPIKINCVVNPNDNGNDKMEVEKYCLSKGLELRFIQQMNLENGIFSVVHGGSGGNCSICNRLRLTSNGKLKPCLFSDLEFDIKTLGYKKAIELAITAKPESGTINHNNLFNNIGG